MGAVDLFQPLWHSVSCKLRADRGSQVREQINVTVIPQRVGLNLPDRLFLKTGRQQVFSKNQFIGSLRALYTRPSIVPCPEISRRFKGITVENRIASQ